MPNHITNILKVTKGDPQVVWDFMRGDERDSTDFNGVKTGEKYREEFDFDKVIPMPAGLSDIQSDGHVMTLTNEFSHDSVKKMAADLRKRNDEKTTENFINALRLYVKTGYADWYSWSIAHWGTKWNSYDYSKVCDDTVKFDTAWACPVPVFMALSKKFPEHEFFIEYADEDIGSNCGSFKAINGEEVDGYEPEGREAELFAYKVKGYDEDEIKEREADDDSDSEDDGAETGVDSDTVISPLQ